MPVVSLVEICSNVIAGRQINKLHRIIFCTRLLQYSLPAGVIARIIDQLPIDEILTLESRFPLLGRIFEEAWRRVCLKCALKSLPFRVRTNRFRSRTQSQPTTYPQSYWSFANEFIFNWESSSLKYRDIFFESYVTELLYIYSQAQDQPSLVYSQDIRGNMIPIKRIKRECQAILQSALGSCKHDIPDTIMIDLLLNHINRFTLHLPLVNSLNDLLNSFEKLDNITELAIPGSIRHCNLSLIFDLVKSILSKSPIQTVLLNIENHDNNEYFRMIKNLLLLFSAPKIGAVELDLWEEALANSSQQLQDCADNDEDLYEFHSTNPSQLQENMQLYQIMNISVSFARFMRTSDKRDMFSVCFNYWYCLETLSVTLNHDDELTLHFCDGLLTLLASKRAKLRNVKIEYGCFQMVTICSLGLYLNGTEAEKSVAFEECIVKYDPKQQSNEEYKCCPKSPEVDYSSVTKVALVRSPHSDTNCIECCDTVSVVSIILQCYNPKKLYICCSDIETSHEHKHKVNNPFVRLSADKIKLTKLKFDQPTFRPSCNDVLALLSDNSCYNSKNIEVDVTCSDFKKQCKYKSIFKRITLTPTVVQDEFSNVDLSIPDFLAQM